LLPVEVQLPFVTVAQTWYNSAMENKPTSYRLPEKVKILIGILSEKMLISKTAVITLAVLEFAKKENVINEKHDDGIRTS
jgi:hypothetical protein